MRYFVLSDIHGSEYYLDRALEAYRESGCDKILLLGDILYHGPRNPLPQGYNPANCIPKLNDLKDEIIAVRGNCDSEVDQMVLEFPIMEDYIILPSSNIMATHGHLYNRELPPKEDGDKNRIRGIIYGHFHTPIADKDDIYILNPGSISLPKDGSDHSYGILSDGNSEGDLGDNSDSTFTAYNIEGKIISSISIKAE